MHIDNHVYSIRFHILSRFAIRINHTKNQHFLRQRISTSHVEINIHFNICNLYKHMSLVGLGVSKHHTACTKGEAMVDTKWWRIPSFCSGYVIFWLIAHSYTDIFWQKKSLRSGGKSWIDGNVHIGPWKQSPLPCYQMINLVQERAKENQEMGFHWLVRETLFPYRLGAWSLFPIGNESHLLVKMIILDHMQKRFWFRFRLSCQPFLAVKLAWSCSLQSGSWTLCNQSLRFPKL